MTYLYKLKTVWIWPSSIILCGYKTYLYKDCGYSLSL